MHSYGKETPMPLRQSKADEGEKDGTNKSIFEINVADRGTGYGDY